MQMHFYYQINTNFGLQLLLMSVISLTAIIFLLHDIYRNLKRNDNSINKILIKNIYMISFYVFRFLYISYICQRSKNEVEYIIYFLIYKYIECSIICNNYVVLIFLLKSPELYNSPVNNLVANCH